MKKINQLRKIYILPGWWERKRAWLLAHHSPGMDPGLNVKKKGLQIPSPYSQRLRRKSSSALKLPSRVTEVSGMATRYVEPSATQKR
jgi:hypothetical protein